uniref:C2H2-type domain-containing protein n=1 Tax=Anopheles merus TaxID=30066 RepID=A0A182VEH7_ANOME
METIVLTRVRTLNTHMKMHEQPIKCDYCDRRYSNAAGKYYHTQTYHLAGGAPCIVHCEICGKQYGSEAALKQHMKYHTTMLKCSRCDMVFNHPNKRRNHELTHNEDRGYECVVCKKVLQTIESYDVHLKKHSQERSYPCTLCPKKFNTSFNLILHLKVHAKNYNYRPAKSWVEHYTILSRDPLQYKCNHCDRYSTDKVNNMISHLQAHFKEYECDQCKRLFATAKQLRAHYTTHTGEKSEMCQHCGKCFSTKNNLRIHLKSHKREIEDVNDGTTNDRQTVVQEYPPEACIEIETIAQNNAGLPVGVCYSCKVTANGIQAFWKTCTQAQETLKAIFSKPRVAKCPEPTEAAVATKSIQESSNLEGGIFATKESFPAECEEIVIDTTSTQVTEEQFANEYEFESYGEELPAGTAEESEEVIELTEPDNQLISDDYSIDYGDDSSSEEFTGNLSSSDRDEYRAPAKKDATTPITETKHICEVCGNAFKSLNGLKAHLLVHSERRDHQCTICGHEFKQRRALVEHIESKHERKTFPCKICGMPYSWKKGLQRHMNTHKGNTLKHVCKVCGKAFPVPHKLKLHMMLHTGDRIHCEFCGKGYRFNYMLTQHKIRVHNMVIEGVKLYSTPKQKRLGDRKK